jgi:hypothetical protein
MRSRSFATSIASRSTNMSAEGIAEPLLRRPVENDRRSEPVTYPRQTFPKLSITGDTRNRYGSDTLATRQTAESARVVGDWGLFNRSSIGAVKAKSKAQKKASAWGDRIGSASTGSMKDSGWINVAESGEADFAESRGSAVATAERPYRLIQASERVGDVSKTPTTRTVGKFFVWKLTGQCGIDRSPRSTGDLGQGFPA